jgi:hypothetical protein
MNIPKFFKNFIIAGFMTLGVTTWQGLYNNLQAQNNKDTYASTISNTTVSLKAEKDKVIKSINSNIAKDINKLWDYRYNHAYRNDVYKDVVWRTLTGSLNDEMKAYLLLAIFDIKKESPYLQQAIDALKSSKTSNILFSRAVTSVEAGISIAVDDQKIDMADQLLKHTRYLKSVLQQGKKE